MTETSQSASEVTGVRLVHAKTLNVVAGSLGMFWATIVFGPYFFNYLRTLGATNFQVGLMGALPAFCGITQIFGAMLVMRLERRRPFWVITSLWGRVLWVPVVVAPYVLGFQSLGSVTAILAFVALAQILAHLCSPAWFSWLGDLIPEHERGRFFGARQVWLFAVGLVIQPAVGWTLDRFNVPDNPVFGFTLVLSMAVLAGCGDIIVHAFIPEPTFVRPDRKIRLLQLLKAPLGSADFLRFIIPVALFNFTILLMAAFVPLWYRNDLGMSYRFMALLTSLNLLVAVLSSRFWGHISDRFGHRPTLIISAWLWLVSPAIYLVTTPGNYLWILPMAAILGGFVTAGWGLGVTNIMLGLSPRANRDMYVGVFFALVGTVAGCGSLVGGVVRDHLTTPWLPGAWMTGFQNLCLITLGLGLVTMVLLHRVRYRAERSVGFVISRLVSANPIRSFGYVNVINAGSSERQKVRAMQQLARMRARLATSDLIARLEDPSLEVREEAATALGRIGDRDATDPLVRVFLDRDSYIELQACRALGLLGDPRAVEPLLTRLRDAPRELKAEICRALGEIADPRAVEPLLSLIRQEHPDTRVLAAAIQALGRMGARSALWEILPLLHATQNPVIRRQLCLSVGDLLGRRDEFYPVLLGEMSVHGSRARRLIRRARRGSRVLGPRTHSTVTEFLNTLHDTYVREDYRRCVDELADLMVFLGRTIFNYSGDIEHLAEAAVLYDSRFGIACWYVDLLHESASSGTRPLFEDVLLAFFFLAQWDYTFSTDLS